MAAAPTIWAIANTNALSAWFAREGPHAAYSHAPRASPVRMAASTTAKE